MVRHTSLKITKEVDYELVELLWKYIDIYIEKYKNTNDICEVNINITSGNKMVFIDFNNAEYKIAFNSYRKPTHKIKLLKRSNELYMLDQYETEVVA